MELAGDAPVGPDGVSVGRWFALYAVLLAGACAALVVLIAREPWPASAWLRDAKTVFRETSPAVKLIGFEQATNVTIGIPIIRTSPAHGTAFEIAGQNIANPAGMKSAIMTAIQMARAKRNLEVRIEN